MDQYKHMWGKHVIMGGYKVSLMELQVKYGHLVPWILKLFGCEFFSSLN